MSTIIVYPNNSITIDGKPSRMRERDLKRLGITPIRIAHTSEETDGAERRDIDGDHFVVFPTSTQLGRGRAKFEPRRHVRLIEKVLAECTKCHRMKPRRGFPRHRGTALGIDSWCKSCHVAINRQRRRQFPSPRRRGQPARTSEAVQSGRGEVNGPVSKESISQGRDQSVWAD